MNKKGGYDDDDYDYEDDDYYEDDYEYYGEEEEDGEYYEEGEYYEDDGTAAAATTAQAAPQQPVTPAFKTISEEADVDYDILAAVVPALCKLWHDRNPLMLSLEEEEAVAALREGNYDVEEAAAALKAKRDAEKKARGITAGAKTLKVATSKTPAPAAAASGDTEAASPSVPKTSGPAAAGAAPGKPLKKSRAEEAHDKKVSKAQPDAEKPDTTFVLAGHVDAGKSTTLGHLLLAVGKIAQTEVARNERDAKGTHKESFKYAWLLDQSEEERRRGVTIDSNAHSLETAHRRVHVLDAPGHKDFVMNMVSSTTQADAALLVVTARYGEFETGLAHGTKDHLMVLKTLGIGHIVVAVNKMDAVEYSEERYHFVVDSLRQLLRQTGVGEDSVVGYCPVSGMTGANLVERDAGATPWYDGPPLLDLLDSCPLDSRLLDGPLRVNVHDVAGEIVYGKVESGKLSKGDKLSFAPCDAEVVVRTIHKATTDTDVDVAFAGETVEIRTKSPLVLLYRGCVGALKDAALPAQHSTQFETHIQTLPTLVNAILPGAAFVMVIHGITVPVRVVRLLSRMKEDGSWSKGMVKCVPLGGQARVVLETESRIAAEPADVCPALGKFILQQDGEIVIGGLVLSVLST